MKILFLYTEIAGYTLICIEEYLKKNATDEIVVVRYPVNNEAPFQIKEMEGFTSFLKPDLYRELDGLVDRVKPDSIICCGWADQEYLKICKKWKLKINITLMFDNYWEATLKQYMAVVFGRFYLKRFFNNCWVPGEPQVEYAKKLGFKEKEIFRHFYSADVSIFEEHAVRNLESKKKKNPHVFLYVGRYLELKGIVDLWSAFEQFQIESPNDWELWCVGTGELFDKKMVHPKIKHFGFVQPKELVGFIEKASVFVMPSHFDHWGVAVQEFAAAGFPLICSDTVGAASAFLIENQNGYSFKARSVIGLKECFKKIVNLSSEELYKMGTLSCFLAKKVSPEIWSLELNKIVKWKKY